MREELDEQVFTSTEWELPRNVTVPLQNSKIYGGQQFERLFFEFRAIISNINPDENDINSMPPIQDKLFLTTACESVGSKTEEILVPLIDQLIERTSFIMKRIPTIADVILMGKESKHNRLQLDIDPKLFLPVAGHLKDLFNSYVDKIAKSCRSQCMEEFYSTKTLVWDISQKVTLEGTHRSEKEVFSDIFLSITERIASNVIRKIYNFFLVPFMNVDLWKEIQTHYFTIDKFTLDEILESHVIEDYLEHELDQREKTYDKLLDSEALLNDLAPKL